MKIFFFLLSFEKKSIDYSHGATKKNAVIWVCMSSSYIFFKTVVKCHHQKLHVSLHIYITHIRIHTCTCTHIQNLNITFSGAYCEIWYVFFSKSGKSCQRKKKCELVDSLHDGVESSLVILETSSEFSDGPGPHIMQIAFCCIRWIFNILWARSS